MFKVSTINIKLPIIKVEKRGFKPSLSFTEIKRNTETSVGGLMRRAKKIGTNQKSKLINKLKGSRNVDSKGKFQIVPKYKVVSKDTPDEEHVIVIEKHYKKDPLQTKLSDFKTNDD